jgi:multiple sugar transport system permease protein/sn-glycerol 3-phosphate transport system permease protein
MRISWPVRFVVYLVVGIAAFCVLFPLLWMFFSALKTQADIIDPNAPIIPTHWEWSNISVAWNSAPFGQFYLNTAIFSLITTAGQIATGMIAGYAFAMFDFPGRRVLFYGVLTGLMIPFTVVLVPVVQILATFGWVDTWAGLLVPNIASALGCFLYRQFFLSAPAELAESARIDGASEWRIFWSIYRPLAQPMTAALTTIVFLQNWNNFLFPLVVTSKESLMMISQGLTIFQGQIKGTQYNLLMAGSLIAVVPVLIVALIAQRRVVDGLMIGATR